MSIKAKILIVTTSLSSGGAERASAMQSHLFTKLGYNVFIVTILSKIDYDYLGTLINFGEDKDKDNSFFGRINRLFKFRKLLSQHKFSFIVDNRARNQSYREFIISKFIYKIPVVYMIHSYNENVAFTKYNRLNRFLYKNETMVAVSDGVANKFADMYRLNKMHTIQNTINFKLIAKQSEKEIEENRNDRYVLYYGRIHDYSKNLKLLLTAYSKSELWHKNIKLVIIGDGPDLEMIKRFSFDLGVEQHVVFKGFMKNPFPIVKRAYFTVLTSRSEGFALVLLESLFLETPVISVACESGPKEIIRHEFNGLLVENYNVKALASAMDRLLLDKKLYSTCKTNAKASVEKLSMENITEKWQELLK